MRYFLKLAYLGRNFHGWQTQPNAVSVQQTLENALSVILRAPTPIVGAGRTDAGVNARLMYAHFDTSTPLPDDRSRLIRGLNSLIGSDIAVYDIINVADDAHARFDATSRTYHYYVHDHKSPFLPLSWQAPPDLDYDLMNRAAHILLETDDFTSFSKLHTDVKTNICDVTEACWTELPQPGRHMFVITADRFLRNMVRAVVGTLVDVGRHKLTPDDFAGIITAKDRCAAGTSMPPEPLFLWNVTYDYIKPEPDITKSID